MNNILKNTWAVLDKTEKKRFVLLTLPDILISMADIVSLALLLWIIQFYIQPVNSHDLSFLPAWLADRNSVWFIALFLLLFGLKNITAWFISRAWYQFIGKVAVRISRINLSNYQHSGFDEFVNTDSSIQIRRIGFQPFEFCQYILSGIPQIINQSILILLTIIAIILFNANLFLLLLVILLPPVIVIFYFIKTSLNGVRNQIKTGNEKSIQHLLDALKGWVESNVYGRNDFFLHRFAGSRKKFSVSLFESISIQNMPPRIIEIFAVLGLFILIAIAKWSGSHNTDYLLTIGAFVGAAYKIIPGIVKIINLSGQISAYEFSVADLVQTDQNLKRKKEIFSVPNLDSIHLKDIGFNYDQQPVLNNFSFSVEKGDFTGITGESGKGKTTLLNLLLGFLSPTKGKILINSIPAGKQVIQHCWPFISYVRQQSFFIHDTILHNITLEEDNHDMDKLQFALEASGISKLTGLWPEGLNKIITENGKNISGGQRQRIAIARALYKNAELFILDEPFSELDEESEYDLLQTFKQLSQSGKMVILVTHNKKSLASCNKIISL
ncbi:MAG: transporter ATP-binding protein [Chitinophagaceae bacterium]|nr:transporter ATP-binding protein [Chitinophagaceae bacterium]